MPLLGFHLDGCRTRLLIESTKLKRWRIWRLINHTTSAPCANKKSINQRNKKWKLLCDWKRNFFCLVGCVFEKKETQKLNMKKCLSSLFFLAIRLSTPLWIIIRYNSYTLTQTTQRRMLSDLLFFFCFLLACEMQKFVSESFPPFGLIVFLVFVNETLRNINSPVRKFWFYL